MKTLAYTKRDAETLRGEFGKYSAIDPIPLPDGMFGLPYRILSDPDLVSIQQNILKLSKKIVEIEEFPAISQHLKKGIFYKYQPGSVDKPVFPLIKCMKSHIRTSIPPEQDSDNFCFFRINSDDLNWIPNEFVQTGWYRIYEDQKYKVIQDHLTHNIVSPDMTNGFWKPVIKAKTEIPMIEKPEKFIRNTEIKVNLNLSNELVESLSDLIHLYENKLLNLAEKEKKLIIRKSNSKWYISIIVILIGVVLYLILKS